MSDLEKEGRDLRERTAHLRRQFLGAELQTCWIAVERAQFELKLGDTHEAQKEWAVAERGAQVIQRFLGDGPERLEEIEAKLAELREAVRALRSELDGAGR